MSGKLQANIARLKDQKVENLEKMDEARSSTEEAHYRMLSRKNQKMIDEYLERLKNDG